MNDFIERQVPPAAPVNETGRAATGAKAPARANPVLGWANPSARWKQSRIA
jgi:hypothetical protein